MAYNAFTWKDDAAGGTPITAARLNAIENGLSAAALRADNSVVRDSRASEAAIECDDPAKQRVSVWATTAATKKRFGLIASDTDLGLYDSSASAYKYKAMLEGEGVRILSPLSDAYVSCSDPAAQRVMVGAKSAGTGRAHVLIASDKTITLYDTTGSKNVWSTGMAVESGKLSLLHGRAKDASFPPRWVRRCGWCCLEGRVEGLTGGQSVCSVGSLIRADDKPASGASRNFACCGQDANGNTHIFNVYMTSDGVLSVTSTGTGTPMGGDSFVSLDGVRFLAA